ncbi:hypothetical protein BSKO_08665 [Bryopsis sp. KO-2023]|nr:hypothetical protein BSKO_08665 [Bryopsis sp. KO-2023]
MVVIRKSPLNRNSVHGASILITFLLLVLKTDAQCNGVFSGGTKCQDDATTIRFVGNDATDVGTNPDSTPDPTLEDPDPQGLRTSGSVAVAVLFIALFNFGFCCCCWCCCRVLDSLNHPLSHRGRLGNRNNIGFPVMQPPPLAPAPVEMHAMGNQANRPQAPKATRNVVIVNPGGDIEIGVPDD